MCQHCVRSGTKLTSYPWPSTGARYEVLPPMDEEWEKLISFSNELAAAVRARQRDELFEWVARSLAVPKEHFAGQGGG